VKGKSLVDRQHPHDFFSEVSVSYAHSFSAATALYVYLGYPGEPALGPVAYMHRPSAMPDPDAPIAHHWQDATHITFGLATLGFRIQNLKIEGSSFTGREPNENRYNFDRPRFDSYSFRLSYNPTRNWALQASRGYIKSPEALNSQENVWRTTASANYSRSVGVAGTHQLVANLVWGLNKVKAHTAEASVGAEAALNVNSTQIYTRYGWVNKSREELVLPVKAYGNPVYAINTFTLGFNKKLFDVGNTRVALGVQGSLYVTPAGLTGLYGRAPIGGEVFLRVSPRLTNIKSKTAHGMDPNMVM